MPVSEFPPFEPHPLLRGGHAQTLAGAYLPWPSRVQQTTEHRVELADGDTIVLHEDLPADWRDGDGTCLMMHGLAGCRLSGYMRRIAEKLSTRGVRVFRMDLRGCGAGEGLVRGTTHCGRWADTASALEFLARLAPASPTALVGFSLGGTIALNLVGELGTAACGHLAGVIAVCPPIDLQAVRRRFDEPTGRPYDRHFVRLLWGKTLLRSDAQNGLLRLERARRPRRLAEFDALVTAPLAGFESVDDYYTRCSPGPRLGAIRVPTTIVAAADDPVVPVGPLQEVRTSAAINVIITRHGGHLGYVGRRSSDPDRRWIDWRVVEWVASTVRAKSSVAV